MDDAKDRRRILVASNRGPVSFDRGDDGVLTVKRGGGGVVSGLSSVAASEDMLWVCAALSDADRAAIRRANGGLLDLDGSPDGSAVRMLDIPPAIFNRAYNTVANSVLWFVHHMLYDTPNRPQFGLAFARDWAAYRAYNLAFAEAVADAAGGSGGSSPRTSTAEAVANASGADGARALIQDYHLTLAPKQLRTMAPDIKIAHFSHTPW